MIENGAIRPAPETTDEIAVACCSFRKDLDCNSRASFSTSSLRVSRGVVSTHGVKESSGINLETESTSSIRRIARLEYPNRMLMSRSLPGTCEFSMDLPRGVSSQNPTGGNKNTKTPSMPQHIMLYSYSWPLGSELLTRTIVPRWTLG
jgi:hypothetical protein